MPERIDEARRIPMDVSWTTSDVPRDELILAGDIGGTNTTLALVARRKKDFTIILKCRFDSQDLRGMEEPIRRMLQEAASRSADLRPAVCCLSGAGPVTDNRCTLSNLSWEIEGDSLADTFGFPVFVINDFVAVSYGVSLLDVEDEDHVLKLPHPGGRFPHPHGTVRGVVGAGTGLGVGYLVELDDRYIAFPSEGGHADFAAFDRETRELKDYLDSRTDLTAGAELFVSGQGIVNIYRFFREIRHLPEDAVIAEIDSLEDEEKPAAIAGHAGDHSACRDMMRLFIKMYGRFAGNASLHFFPTRGMFIAGGIVTKNERLLLDDDLFMRYFEMNYKETIREVLKNFPVYIIRNYSVSLYGAAQAACSLRKTC